MLTLTADELPRFMACNGSRSITQVQPFAPDDTMRNEGDAAHWLIEQVFNRKYGTDELVDRPAFNGVYVTEQMIEDVTPCINAIQGRGAVEVVTSYSDGVAYDVRGRADWIAFEGTTLHVGDFKYGWSIVEPEENWTLLSHVMGWCYNNPNLCDQMTDVILHIWQPRPHHPLGKVRSVPYSKQQLQQFWVSLFFKLTQPDGMLNTSKHCKDCLGMINCPAAQKAGLNAIDMSEKAYVSELDDSTIAFVLEQYERAAKILEQLHKAASELALHRIKAGNIVPGYGIEKDLTNKQWKQGITVEAAQAITGKDLSKKQLITPAQAVKAGVSQEAIDALCERREKGVKLSKIDPKTAVKKILNRLT